MKYQFKTTSQPAVPSDLLSRIIAHVPHDIFWKDRDSRFLGCNPSFAKAAGTTPEDIIGKTDYDMPWREQAAKYVKDDQEVMRLGKSKTGIEDIQQQADGKEIVALVSKVPLRDQYDNVIGILGIYTDITERKEYEKQLLNAKLEAEAANQAKTEFLANMRHDIRTSLTGIVGFANLIKEESNNPKIAEYSTNLQASCQALLDFFNEVLDAIRITSGEIPISKQKFNLQVKLQSIVSLYQAKANEKHLAISLEYDEAIPNYLIGDSKRIHRIILELVANALKFTPSGQVVIEAKLARQKDDQVIITLSVKDTGIGILPEVQEEIFTPFNRLTASYEGNYQGIGWGLTIVKRFVEDLNGEIYLESKINQGSHFTCVIPLKESLLDNDLGVTEEPVTLPVKKLFPEIFNNLNKPIDNRYKVPNELSILLVEDQLIAAKVTVDMLTRLGYQIDVAVDGREALQKAKANNYDLIFMDVGLPIINGLDVTRELRIWEKALNKHIPIIALTAHMDVENKQECIESGMDAVLSKPMLKETAIDIINAFVPQYRQNQTAENQSPIAFDAMPETVIDLSSVPHFSENDQESLKEMLQLLIDSIPVEREHLAAYYHLQDWREIRNIVHKLKGGSCYCGTGRLTVACENLEKYLRSNETELRDALYQQVLQEMAAVEQAFRRL